MTTALDVIDERIEAAELNVEAALGHLKGARALCDRLEEERRQAQGRLNRGDAPAAEDLDRLRGEFLTARTAAQDADTAVSNARAKVQPLKDERKKVEAAVVAEHLGPVLDLRAALAVAFEAQADQLAKTAALYRQTVKESIRLGGLLGAPMGQHLNAHIDIITARRLLLRLRPELMAEFTHLGVHPEDPLGKQDPEATAHLRARIEQILGVPTAAGA